MTLAMVGYSTKEDVLLGVAGAAILVPVCSRRFVSVRGSGGLGRVDVDGSEIEDV